MNDSNKFELKHVPLIYIEKMQTDKELEKIWPAIESAVKKISPKIVFSEVEVCSTCPLGPYISLKIKDHLMFFVADGGPNKISIVYHQRPSTSVMENAVLVRAFMLAYVWPIHTVAAKISKRD